MEHTEYESDPQMPPSQGERLRVARIGKPHGIRGEVTVQLFTDEPTERLAPGAVLLREPGLPSAETEPSGETRGESAELGTLTVASQRWNKKICLLGFEEVPDRNAAEKLRGTILFIDVVDHDDDEEGWYSHELEGFRCISDQGVELGTVSALLTGSAQDILVVTSQSGEEVMVPFVDDIVPEVNSKDRLITLTPPAGLFP